MHRRQTACALAKIRDRTCLGARAKVPYMRAGGRGENVLAQTKSKNSINNSVKGLKYMDLISIADSPGFPPLEHFEHFVSFLRGVLSEVEIWGSFPTG